MREHPTAKVAEQIADVYRLMAGKGRYRPAAPSDGMGHITVPLRELDLDAEIALYAEAWWRQENAMDYQVGVPSFELRPALILAVETARACCSADRDLARRLLAPALEACDEH